MLRKKRNPFDYPPSTPEEREEYRQALLKASILRVTIGLEILAKFQKFQ